ncbi:MAG: hypothetical protein CL398_11275 [Acidiferrobacteraceae bacterium]|nr:hypothetical protein [Acidiferrobacteraceae bacterium]|tara:strand:- start:9079 stop:10281 length:1203 start_codon:yes stop_codon:yes gene_type:complete
MTASDIRCGNDLKLYEKLLRNTDVKQAQQKIAKLEKEQKNHGIRRHLLATSVRLSQSMSKPLHHMVSHCREKLGVDSPLELYAYASPQFNAACFKPEDGRVFVMFSSAILESFSETELLFVVGHELGHHYYRHHDIPIGYVLKQRKHTPPELALDLFTWSRYAEVSADRAGAFCAENLNSVAKALFKLASGISSDHIIKFDLDQFLNQVDDMMAFDSQPGYSSSEQDWFLTHPFSPLRVKALKYFHESELMDGTISSIELEDRVRQIMEVMEPSYLEGKTSGTRAMRNLFIAAAIAIADAHLGIGKKEREVLQQFLSKNFTIENLDRDKLRELLPQRIVEAKAHTTVPQRMQVVRDLCIVASAEQEIADAEIEVLLQVVTDLDIAPSFLTACIESSTELD